MSIQKLNKENLYYRSFTENLKFVAEKDMEKEVVGVTYLM